MSKKAEKGEPMDKSAPEGNAAMHVNHERQCYALGQLVTEVEALFPGVGYEFSNKNPRNVFFDAQFDTYSVTEEDRQQFETLLRLIRSDERVEEVIADSEGVLVSFRNNVHTMDDRRTFDLADAWIILTEDES